MADSPVVLRDVHKSFGSMVVLDGLTMDFPAGQTTAVIGPSGTGKSVLLKHIVGLLEPDRGEVRVFGTDMARAPESARYAVRKRLGMLFQDGALFDSLTVGENIEFPLVQHRKDLSATKRRERVAEVLKMVELPGIEERAISSLSGGQRKRVGLARAIVHSPEMVLFDEPNSGLDPMTSDAIDQLIGHLKRSLGITFVVITHDIVSSIHIADRIAMLYGGKLVAWGTVQEVLHSPEPVVQRFFSRNLQLPTGEGEARLLSAPASALTDPSHSG
jgi:phospholipid/cholesterol/gamma-HCH transport system ATP-binding protein